MDPQVEDSEQTVSEVKPQVEVSSPTDSHGITVASMAAFVLLSLGAVAFLYYQNQQLKGMLASYQTPVATSTPTATPDVTASWKTYTNTSANYSIKYPIDWKVENYGLMNPKPALTDTKKVRLFFQPNLSKVAIELNIEEVLSISANTQFKSKEIKTIGIDESSKCWTTGDTMTSFCWLKVPNASKYLNFVITNYNEPSDKAQINQILSTFKFFEKQTPIGTGIEIGISCQQNGKIYKNGESVPSGDKCNTCSCDNGQIACTLIACP